MPTVSRGHGRFRCGSERARQDRGRVERIPYELCVLVALRDAIRRREVFIGDARRWRDPDHDLPADFDTTRDVHYESLRQPTDPQTFIADLRERMAVALTKFDQALGDATCGGVRIDVLPAER